MSPTSSNKSTPSFGNRKASCHASRNSNTHRRNKTTRQQLSKEKARQKKRKANKANLKPPPSSYSVDNPATKVSTVKKSSVPVVTQATQVHEATQVRTNPYQKRKSTEKAPPTNPGFASPDIRPIRLLPSSSTSPAFSNEPPSAYSDPSDAILMRGVPGEGLPCATNITTSANAVDIQKASDFESPSLSRLDSGNVPSSTIGSPYDQNSNTVVLSSPTRLNAMPTPPSSKRKRRRQNNKKQPLVPPPPSPAKLRKLRQQSRTNVGFTNPYLRNAPASGAVITLSTEPASASPNAGLSVSTSALPTNDETPSSSDESFVLDDADLSDDEPLVVGAANRDAMFNKKNESNSLNNQGIWKA